MSCSWRSEAEGRWAGGRQQDCRISYLGEREEGQVSPSVCVEGAGRGETQREKRMEI